MKRIYLIRHCQASGQEQEAPLTDTGVEQSYALAHFLEKQSIQKIVSSPYKRATSSIMPFANKVQLHVETNDDLSERVLSGVPLSDWFEKLKRTFQDPHLKFEGGESSFEATTRAIHVIEPLIQCEEENIVVVTHGNLLSLILKHFDEKFGFEEWRTLTNPDVFLLQYDEQKWSIERLWNKSVVEKQVQS